MGVPYSSTVLTKAIGRGPTAPSKIVCLSLVESSKGENDGIDSDLFQNYSFPTANGNLFNKRIDFIESTYIYVPLCGCGEIGRHASFRH